MKHLALILSRNMRVLAQLHDAGCKAGFSVNCVNRTGVALALIARYTNDFHVVVIDEAAAGRRLPDLIRGIRGNAPKTRVLVALRDGSCFEYDDPLVSVRSMERACALLPRLKRDVTRYRSNPVRKRATG